LRRRIVLSLAIVTSLAVPCADAQAASLFEFLFGPRQPAPPQQANAFSNPHENFGPGPEAQPTMQRMSGYCVRLCDGRYFPVTAQGNASPAEMCQSFCPASATRVYSGGSIDYAVNHDGSRYRELKNAFVYRERFVAGCTCNGRDSVGLAPVDLAMDPTLRRGDIVATTEGLYAYNGPSSEGQQNAQQFTPVASYPGLSADLRAKLGEMKVAPTIATAEIAPPEPAALPAPRIMRTQIN
jgi:hypothetical protein